MASVKLNNFEGRSVDELRGELNALVEDLNYILCNLSAENMDDSTAEMIGGNNGNG